MKVRTEVTVQKLRGGFYTPDELVDLALRRLLEQLDRREALRILEPAAGDGAFLRGLARLGLNESIDRVTAVEISEREAERCRSTASALGLSAEIIPADFLSWQLTDREQYDVAVGNPPFVRFQFVDDASKLIAKNLAEDLGLPARGVANLWVPILLGALRSLRVGGAFSFVVPAECFTGVSAGAVRTWLVRECANVTVDLFAPGSFPGVLQEVVVLSGRRSSNRAGTRTVSIVDHAGEASQWSHRVSAEARSWTHLLLRPDEIEVLEHARELPSIKSLGAVAKFEVAAVTGANAFFSINHDTMLEFALDPWTVPLLPRLRHARGLIYSQGDHDALVRSGMKSGLLDFSSDRPNPERSEGAARYLRSGEIQDLHLRYKTRIRDIWYRVPLVRSEPLMLSKRAHGYHRMVLNEAGAATTDTIYRGWTTSQDVTARDLVAGFHNSLTLLTAEIEGRSFGGGVLELVPSEVDRLSIPAIPDFGVELNRFDAVARSTSGASAGPHPLIVETNAFLAKADFGLDVDQLDVLEEGRRRLARRRIDRARSSAHSGPNGQQTLDLGESD